MWPEVTGMGELDETIDDGEDAAGNVNGDGAGTDGPIEIPDDEEDVDRDDDAPTADSPFGGMDSIAVANRASNQA